MATRDPIRLSAIEEAILLWEGTSVPWNSQFDVSAPRLDADRLRGACNAALAHHELTTCGVCADDSGGFMWVAATEPVDVGEIPVVECADEEAVEQARIRQLDEPIPLDRPPLLRVVIARRPHDDLILTSASHVLCDGLGLLRLVRSVSRAYVGEVDPPPAVDVTTARRLLEPAFPTTVHGAVQTWATTVQLAASAIVGRSRIAPRGGSDTPGFGVVTRSVDLGVLSASKARHTATFDDFVVAALHLTIDRWNGDGAPSNGRIGVSLGVNLRAFEWYDDVVANLATFVSVTSDAEHRRDLDSVLETVRPQLAFDTRLERARLVAGAASAARALPFAARKQALARVTPDRFDSIAISNGGRVADPPRFAPDHEPEAWVSQPAVPAVGLAMGVFSLGAALRITVRYRRERFDAAGAAAFTDAFIAVLTGD